jgi:hypothetical protein
MFLLLTKLCGYLVLDLTPDLGNYFNKRFLQVYGHVALGLQVFVRLAS